MLNYRPDIDGLRAIAVLLVILYHLDLPWPAGGYIGVDIFFVISGYLIGSIVIGGIDSGDFSLVDFYERRIRRIFPALFAVILFCGVAGYGLLLPDLYCNLGKNIAATSAFVSNIVYWHEIGYFDLLATQKPLLHTWSLAVEEQFYLGFPLFIMLARHVLHGRWIAATAGLLLLSLAGCAFITYRFTGDAAFYLTPARIWELLLGTMLIPLPPKLRLGSGGRGALVLAGLALIIMAATCLSKDTRYPGAAALLPTMGAALVILGGGGANAVSRVLGGPPFGFVGRISYSLYLWHVPLLVFVGQFTSGQTNPVEKLGLLGLIFAVSALSWRYIEQPCRGRAVTGAARYRLFAAAGMATVLAVAFGLVVDARRGLLGQFSKAEAGLLSERFGVDAVPGNHADCHDLDHGVAVCTLGSGTAKPDFVLWGDSHAHAISPALDAAASRAGHAGYDRWKPGCPPMIGPLPDSSAGCVQANAATFAWIMARPDLTNVILGARWFIWTIPARHGEIHAGFTQTVRRLVAAGKHVWIVGPIPEPVYEVRQINLLRLRGYPTRRPPDMTQAELAMKYAVSRNEVTNVAAKFGIPVLWPDTVLCGQGSCREEDAGGPLYVEMSHLSPRGALSVSSIFDPVFAKTSR